MLRNALARFSTHLSTAGCAEKLRINAFAATLAMLGAGRAEKAGSMFVPRCLSAGTVLLPQQEELSARQMLCTPCLYCRVSPIIPSTGTLPGNPPGEGGCRSVGSDERLNTQIRFVFQLHGQLATDQCSIPTLPAPLR